MSTNISGQYDQRPNTIYPSTMSKMDAGGSRNVNFSSMRDTEDEQIPASPSKSTNGIGGFLKRLTPKYRSRSKSPASAAGQSRGDKKSWVTVEIKDCQTTTDYPSSPTRENYSPTTSSSPASPVLRNGCSSPDKSPRLRSTFGNLFHRGSMKKPSSSCKTPSSMGNKFDIRTRSEDELTAESGQKTTTNGDKFTARRLLHETDGDIRDGLLSGSGAARGAMSEEDLVSKSLCKERTDVLKPLRAINAVSVNLSPLVTTTGAYHSQDSVFDSPARVPSYVRISCTLSGYRNYRNVSLGSPQSPMSPKFGCSLKPLGTTSISAFPSTAPIGKSIVERRLEKFNNPQQQYAPTSNATPARGMDVADGTTPTPIRDLIKNFNTMNLQETTTPVRPRQKPPPVPPRRESEQEQEEQCPSIAVLSLHLQPELKEMNVPVAVSRNGEREKECEITITQQITPQQEQQQQQIALEKNVIPTKLPKPDTAHFEIAFQRQSTDAGVTSTLAVNNVANATNHVVVSHRQSEGVNGEKSAPAAAAYAVTSTELNGCASESSSTMDGYFYRTAAAKDRQRLQIMCEGAENDLANIDLPEDAADDVRRAVGKVRLLLNKKFKKFEELIEKNLNPLPGDPCPTYVADLESFYDIVQIEIKDIDSCFETVRRLKENNWQPLAHQATNGSTKPKNAARPSAQPPKRPQQRTGDANLKAAATERLREAKAAAMQRKKAAEATISSTDDIVSNEQESL